MKDVLSKAGQIIQAVDNYVSNILIRYGRIAAICDKTDHATSFPLFASGIVQTHLKLHLRDAATFDKIKLSADVTLQELDNSEKYV